MDTLAVPPQEDNRVEKLFSSEGQRAAERIARAHSGALSRRRYRDLTAEMYLLHIDGAGDSQWAAIYRGERIVFPRDHRTGVREQENLLRPIVENAVAYHTTMPFEFVVEARKDRASRKRAKVEQAWINALAQEARWNAVHAESMNLAMAYGSCPIHQFWRDDTDFDAFEPVAFASRDGLMQQAQRGYIDMWAGNPFDTTYDAGSTLDSVFTMRYGRLVPAWLVRQAFGHIPQIANLTGSTRIPSASVIQRIARRWMQADLGVHGTGTLYSGPESEELIALIYEEVPKGVDPEWPEGRLSIVALDGSASTDADMAPEGGFRNAMLLHEDALPGGDFSARRVYSKARFDDVLGAPFVGDLDDLQTSLNQYVSAVAEYGRRAKRSPMVSQGAVPHDDTTVFEQDAMLEVEFGSQFQPFYLEPPSAHVPVMLQRAEEVRNAMFRIGGWQAASRGEANAGDPASKVVALAKYDDQIHGPINLRFRETVEANARFAWRLMKEFGDVPWMIGEVGDELAHLADLWVSRDDLSDRPPQFRLVSGYGASAEARGQQLLNLFGLVDAQGREVMDTPTFKRLWPDAGLFANADDAEEIRRRRPRQLNEEIEKACAAFRETTGFEGTRYSDPWVQQAAQMIFVQFDAEFPLLMDDLIEAHLEALTLLTQDETQDPLVRHVARFRMDQLMQWLAMRQMGAGVPPTAEQTVPGGAPPGGGAEGRDVIQQAKPANTVNSNAMQQASAQVPALTKQAQNGG